LTGLANGGYPFARVHFSLAVDTVDTTVNVHWQIIPGPSAVFDTVSIHGIEHVSKDLILDKLSFKKGERYDAGKLAASQTALYNLSLFNAVTVQADLQDTIGCTVPVSVILKEATRVKVFMGAGYGKEEEWRLTAEVRMIDVIGDADRLTLELKRSALQPYEIKVTYIQPNFLFDNLLFSVIPTVRSETETAYSMKRLGSRISLDYPLFKYLQGSVGYGIEKIDLDTTSIASTNPADQILESYMKNSITVTLLRSNAVPLFDPVRGMTASVRFTISGLQESDPYQFQRVLLDLKRYDRVWGRAVLASRLAVGSIHSGEEGGFVPVEERFYAGGSNSNRGWARFRLGPEDLSGIPTGGSSLIDGSLEIRQPLLQQVSLVMFTDYAEVLEQSRTYTWDALHFAVGFGVRYATAIGPIRLDIAKPVFEGDLPSQYILSIGHAY
jgi:outer membrane protein insertion porin family